MSGVQVHVKVYFLVSLILFSNYACDAFKKNFNKLENEKSIIKEKDLTEIFLSNFTFGMSIIASLIFGKS